MPNCPYCFEYHRSEFCPKCGQSYVDWLGSIELQKEFKYPKSTITSAGADVLKFVGAVIFVGFFLSTQESDTNEPSVPNSSEKPHVAIRGPAIKKELPVTQDNRVVWKLINDPKGYVYPVDKLKFERRYDWGIARLFSRCTDSDEGKGYHCYKVLTTHAPSEKPSVRYDVVLDFEKETQRQITRDLMEVRGFVPVKQAFNLMQYSVETIWYPGAVVSYPFEQPVDSQKVFKDAEKFIRENPDAQVLRCAYVSHEPKRYFHEAVFWYGQKPKGVEPEQLKKIDPRHPFLYFGDPITTCPQKWTSSMAPTLKK